MLGLSRQAACGFGQRWACFAQENQERRLFYACVRTPCRRSWQQRAWRNFFIAWCVFLQQGRRRWNVYFHHLILITWIMVEGKHRSLHSPLQQAASQKLLFMSLPCLLLSELCMEHMSNFPLKLVGQLVSCEESVPSGPALCICRSIVRCSCQTSVQTCAARLLSTASTASNGYTMDGLCL